MLKRQPKFTNDEITPLLSAKEKLLDEQIVSLTFEEIPVEVMALILEYLSAVDLAKIELLSKHFKFLFDRNPSITNSLWKNILRREIFKTPEMISTLSNSPKTTAKMIGSLNQRLGSTDYKKKYYSENITAQDLEDFQQLSLYGMHTKNLTNLTPRNLNYILLLLLKNGLIDEFLKLYSDLKSDVELRKNEATQDEASQNAIKNHKTLIKHFSYMFNTLSYIKNKNKDEILENVNGFLNMIPEPDRRDAYGVKHANSVIYQYVKRKVDDQRINDDMTRRLTNINTSIDERHIVLRSRIGYKTGASLLTLFSFIVVLGSDRLNAIEEGRSLTDVNEKDLEAVVGLPGGLAGILFTLYLLYRMVTKILDHCDPQIRLIKQTTNMNRNTHRFFNNNTERSKQVGVEKQLDVENQPDEEHQLDVENQQPQEERDIENQTEPEISPEMPQKSFGM